MALSVASAANDEFGVAAAPPAEPDVAPAGVERALPSPPVKPANALSEDADTGPAAAMAARTELGVVLGIALLPPARELGTCGDANGCGDGGVTCSIALCVAGWEPEPPAPAATPAGAGVAAPTALGVNATPAGRRGGVDSSGSGDVCGGATPGAGVCVRLAAAAAARLLDARAAAAAALRPNGICPVRGERFGE